VKSIDTVIELNEQKHMETDHEYANAVNRLHICKCIFDDMGLFNSRIIKNSTNPKGVDMGIAEHLEAVSIVSTNAMRTAIDMKKADVITRNPSNPELFLSVAYDTISSELVSNFHQKQLLQLDLSVLTQLGSLLAFIPLYIGIPVILRGHNISTDLKIINGSKGVVRHIEKILFIAIYTCKGCIDRIH